MMLRIIFVIMIFSQIYCQIDNKFDGATSDIFICYNKNNGDHSWSLPDTWLNNKIPTINSTVYVIQCNIIINNITNTNIKYMLVSESKFTVEGNLTANNIVNYSNFTVDKTGFLFVEIFENPTLFFNYGNIFINKSLYNNGIIHSMSTIIYLARSVTLSGSGQLILNNSKLIGENIINNNINFIYIIGKCFVYPGISFVNTNIYIETKSILSTYFYEQYNGSITFVLPLSNITSNNIFINSTLLFDISKLNIDQYSEMFLLSNDSLNLYIQNSDYITSKTYIAILSNITTLEYQISISKISKKHIYKIIGLSCALILVVVILIILIIIVCIEKEHRNSTFYN